MHRVQVAFHATISSLDFDDADEAQAAYEKIKEAIREYRMFKNDRPETVEVDTESGKCTFKLERMDSVLIDEIDPEGAIREALQHEVIARRLREEMGLPELSPRRRSPQENASD